MSSMILMMLAPINIPICPPTSAKMKLFLQGQKFYHKNLQNISSLVLGLISMISLVKVEKNILM